MGGARPLALRLLCLRRGAARRQHRFTLSPARQTSFHASRPDDRRRDMERQERERIALHRFGVIAEATPERLSAAERGVIVRAIAGRAHTHPDGSERRYSRQSIDRWLRAWRSGGLAALEPAERSDTGELRSHPELFAAVAQLRLELPSRSSAQIASIVFHRHGVRISERTVREQLRRRGLHKEALAAEPKV